VLPAVHALRVRYYAPYEALARCYGLPPEAKPWCYDIAETQQWLGYVPRYSLRQALESWSAMALPARPGLQGAGPTSMDSLPGPLCRLTHQPSAAPALECAGPIPEGHTAQSWAETAPRKCS
jgi:hypothetical protein